MSPNSRSSHETRGASLLVETSFAPGQALDERVLVEQVVDGLITVGAMQGEDLGRIATTWVYTTPNSYPVPTVERDQILAKVQPWLANHGIFSRGRFGAWLYETGNMDHSVMQGVDFANAVASSGV